MKSTMTPVASAEFVIAMNHFTSGVAIVTTVDDGRPAGATVAAIAPIASDPPTVMVSMSSMSSTAAAIARAGRFAINILDENSATVAGRFATRAPDKFAGLEVTFDEWGNPILPSRVAAVSCEVVEIMAAGSHSEIRATVVDVDVIGGSPLAYFRGSFAHVTTDADTALLAAVRSHVLSIRADKPLVLVPEHLASDLAAPQGAILRALSTLKSEALVERRDGVYYVESVPEDLVDRTYDAKLAIEIGVAVQIVDRVTEPELQALRARLERASTAATGGSAENVDDYVTAMNDFCEYFVGLAGSEPLLHAYRTLGLPGIDKRTITTAIFAQIPATGGFEDVIESLERRDLDAVLESLRSDKRTPAFVRDAATRLRASTDLDGD